jgi:hypothetical protein
MHSHFVSSVFLVVVGVLGAASTTDPVEYQDHVGVYYLVIKLAADLTLY